ILNYVTGVAIWPDQHGGRRVDRGVALISQSSNVAINLTMQTRGLPVAHVVCIGNQAQTGLAEIAEALIAEPTVTALGLFVEGVGDAAAFAAMAERAHAAGKPVVALKSGRGDGARAAIASHTAALSGEGAASSAFLRACGVAEAETLPEMLALLTLLHLFGPLAGRRVAIMACSGGEAGLMADLAAPLPLELPQPAPANAERLTALLGPLVRVANPLDYHTFVWGDRARMQAVFAAMMGEEYDLTVLVMDLPHATRCDATAWEPTIEALIGAQRETGARVALLTTLPENLPEALAERLMDAGIAPLAGASEALSAIAAASPPVAEPGWCPLPALPDSECHILSEAEAKHWLGGNGVPVPEGRSCTDLSEAAAAARRLGGRVALKGLGIAHKSEAGAVRLGLIAGDIAASDPIPGAQGYLVERMVEGGAAELLIGLRRDPVYGASLTLGMGGVEAELLEDTATLILPACRAAMRDALLSLRLAPRLTGYRGRPAADIEAALDIAERLAALIATEPGLEEVEINPLILRRAGEGAVAADALIRWRTT
ncbi:MAG: CoA-binding protein, partial [Alphaproteobacteria bacterium]